jgi:hypothetical protein
MASDNPFINVQTIEPTESSSKKKSMKLNEFKVGDNQVIVEHGQFIFIAVVYSGPGRTVLHQVIEMTISDIENNYRENLEYWSGETTKLKGIVKYLEQLLPHTQTTSTDDSETGIHPDSSSGARFRSWAHNGLINIRNSGKRSKSNTKKRITEKPVLHPMIHQHGYDIRPGIKDSNNIIIPPGTILRVRKPMTMSHSSHKNYRTQYPSSRPSQKIHRGAHSSGLNSRRKVYIRSSELKKL